MDISTNYVMLAKEVNISLWKVQSPHCWKGLKILMGLSKMLSTTSIGGDVDSTQWSKGST